MKIFVYGTLMSGFRNNFFLEEFDRQPLTIEGYEMIDLGNFPAIRKSKDKSSRVTGELYCGVDRLTLEDIDRLEGFDPYDSPEDSFYMREVLESPGVPQNSVWVYVLNSERFESAPVPSGDWRKYSQEKKTKFDWEKIMRAWKDV